MKHTVCPLEGLAVKQRKQKNNWGITGCADGKGEGPRLSYGKTGKGPGEGDDVQAWPKG